MFICWDCGKEMPEIVSIGRQTTCPICHASLHCCKNCDFYDPNEENQCREPAADWVSDKERANFCDYYVPPKKKTLSWHKHITKEEAEERWRRLTRGNK